MLQRRALKRVSSLLLSRIVLQRIELLLVLIGSQLHLGRMCIENLLLFCSCRLLVRLVLFYCHLGLYSLLLQLLFHCGKALNAI